MKILLRNSRGTEGSTLLVALMIAGLVGLLLVSYLNLVKSQNYNTVRSQAWNSAIPVIEAGIEDALAHLNAHGATNLVGDGWLPMGNVFVTQRMIGNNYYLVSISNYIAGASNNAPVIESRGFVDMPYLVSAPPGSPAGAFLAAAGVPDPNKKYFSRGVRATTMANGYFTKAMVAKGIITLSGSVTTDSFNSQDPAWSTNGLYDPTPAKTRDRGDVASNGSLIKEINSSGQVKVYGHVSTGPGGTVGFNGQAAMGSKGWIDGGSVGIEPGWFRDDMNVAFPDVEVPFTTGYWTPGAGTVDGTNYDKVILPGNNRLSSLSLSGTKKVIVNGHASLYVVGNVSMSGNAVIYIPPGASLKLYVGGSASLAGNGVANATGQATSFNYFGLPSNTSLSLSGNATFIGVIYAPGAAFSMSGGGVDPTDFVGASITASVNMTGNYKFHYDESLATYGPAKSFVVTSWNEMTPQEVAAVPTSDF